MLFWSGDESNHDSECKGPELASRLGCFKSQEDLPGVCPAKQVQEAEGGGTHIPCRVPPLGIELDSLNGF